MKTDNIENVVNDVIDNVEKVVEEKTSVTPPVEEKQEEKQEDTPVENEMSEKEYLEKTKLNHKDILKLFYFIYAFTFCLLISKFVSFVFFGTYIDIDMSRLANTLNASIIFIGSAEGIRSMMYSAREEVGKSVSVPAYKLKFLFGYLISFALITIAAVIFEFYVKYKFKTNDIIPDFNANDFISGLLSNTLSYLIARYGDKVAINIDLSNLTFFRRK